MCAGGAVAGELAAAAGGGVAGVDGAVCAGLWPVVASFLGGVGVAEVMGWDWKPACRLVPGDEVEWPGADDGRAVVQAVEFPETRRARVSVRVGCVVAGVRCRRSKRMGPLTMVRLVPFVVGVG